MKVTNHGVPLTLPFSLGINGNGIQARMNGKQFMLE